MNFYFQLALNLSILIPALVGLIRFKKVHESYHPFIYYIWAGFLNEWGGAVAMFMGYPNIPLLNVYMLLETIILIYFFFNLHYTAKKKWISILLYTCTTVFWVLENTLFGSINIFDSYFRMGSAMLICFLAINALNYLIVTERKSLLKNPVFIICSAFILFYTMSVLSETFYIYGANSSGKFQVSIYHITIVANFISLILYTLAIIWMPTKFRFTLPSS